MGTLEQVARDRFGRQAVAAIRAAGATAKYDASRFAVTYRRTDAHSDGVVFLENMFRESAEDHADLMARIVALATTSMTDGTWSDVRPKLRPVLRPASFGQGVQGRDEMPTPLARPALPYLVEMVVIDHEQVMAYANSESPVEWGVSVDEIFAAARENMADYAAATLEQEATPEPAILRFVGDYPGALLLIDGWLAGMEAKLGTPLLAFVTEHAGLLVAPAGPPDAVLALLRLAEDEFRDAARPVSPVAYTCDTDGRVVPYHVPVGDPAWQAVRHAEVELSCREYWSQTASLRPEYEDAGVDEFVCSLIRCRADDGTEFAVASWTDEIESLLPQAHYVAVGAGDEMVLVPWDTVVAELGLMPVGSLYPPRFRVGAYPPAAVMARLRAAAARP